MAIVQAAYGNEQKNFLVQTENGMASVPKSIV